MPGCRTCKLLLEDKQMIDNPVNIPYDGLAMDTKGLHPIRSVAFRTGLSPHVIRAWESRYSAVEPSRTDTNRRLYTDDDIERLQLLRLATQGGRGISHVAGLPTEELRRLVTRDGTPGLTSVSPQQRDREPAGYHLDTCLAAVCQFDGALLEERMLQASVTLSAQSMIEDLLVPLMKKIGDLWHEGGIRPAHEHLASVLVRNVLGVLAASHQAGAGAPELIVTTPSGQWHELGALAAAATAAAEGWRVSYLGPNLPAEDIAAAAHSRRARAVALSLAYPEDDPHLHAELVRLRRLLPASTALVVGGSASGAYASALSQAAAVAVSNLAEFRDRLRSLRASDRAEPSAPPPKG